MPSSSSSSSSSSSPFILPKSLFTTLKNLQKSNFKTLPQTSVPPSVPPSTSLPPNTLITYPTPNLPPSHLRYYSPLLNLVDTEFGLIGRSIRYRPKKSKIKHCYPNSTTKHSTDTEWNEWRVGEVTNYDPSTKEYTLNKISKEGRGNVVRGYSRSCISLDDFSVEALVIISKDNLDEFHKKLFT